MLFAAASAAGVFAVACGGALGARLTRRYEVVVLEEIADVETGVAQAEVIELEDPTRQTSKEKLITVV